MKKSTWKKLTGKSLALLMALVMAGSNVSYAAALTETAFAAENAVDQEDASFEDSSAEDEQSGEAADEFVVSEGREETDPEESAGSDAAETAETVREDISEDVSQSTDTGTVSSSDASEEDTAVAADTDAEQIDSSDPLAETQAVIGDTADDKGTDSGDSDGQESVEDSIVDDIEEEIVSDTDETTELSEETFEEDYGTTVETEDLEIEQLQETASDPVTIYWGINADGELKISSKTLPDEYTATGDFLSTVGWSSSPFYRYTKDIDSIVIGAEDDAIKLTRTSNLFSYLSKARIIDLRYLDTSDVTDMSGMFRGCSALTSLDVSTLDTSNVTDMDYMFADCSGLTSLDISTLDTSNVTDMKFMFDGCSRIAGLDISILDTSNVTDMSYMFSRCGGLTGLDVSTLDTRNVTNMSAMFWGCSGLTSLDVSALDTSNVTDMSAMFADCSGLTNLDISTLDTNNVTNMKSMFRGCSGLTSLDVSSLDTSNVTNMESIFEDCSGLTGLDISRLDTSSVTDMGFMFFRCNGLTNLDVSTLNTRNVTDMRYMFSGCGGLTSLDVSTLDTRNVTNMSAMFWGCDGLTSLDVSRLDTSNVTDMSVIFSNCSGLTSLDVSTLDTSNVTDMSEMFYGSSGLTSLDVSTLDTSNVTDMSGMFDGCRGLTSLDVSTLDTSKVTDMLGMFRSCSNLTNIDISGFNTEKVLYMNWMFSCCEGLTELDLSKMDTRSVVSMEGMFDFYGRSSLKTIYVSDSWSVDAVTESYIMFGGCTSLVGGKGTAYDPEHIDKEYARVDGGSDAPGYLTYKDNPTINEGVPLSITPLHSNIVESGSIKGVRFYISSKDNNNQIVGCNDISGAIRVYDYETDKLVYSYRAYFPEVLGTKTLTINLRDSEELINALSFNKKYYILMDKGFINFEDKDTYAEITTKGAWTISTSTAVKSWEGEVEVRREDLKKNAPYSFTFTYSDDYFLTPSTKYQHDRTVWALSLAMSAFNAYDLYGANEYYEKGYLNAEKYLEKLGFISDTFMASDGFKNKPQEGSIGVCAASKTVSVNGEDVTLIAVPIRGAGYELEWVSNVTVGLQPESHGFRDAAYQAYVFLTNYIKSQSIVGRVKFVLAGYSRAGATANILGKLLIDGKIDGVQYGYDDVYAYCFECPMTTTDESAKDNSGKYNGIVNIINPSDLVPKVPLAAWGFTRYGVDYLIPDYSVKAMQKGGYSLFTDSYKDITGKNYYERTLTNNLGFGICNNSGTYWDQEIFRRLKLTRNDYFYNIQNSAQDAVRNTTDWSQWRYNCIEIVKALFIQLINAHIGNLVLIDSILNNMDYYVPNIWQVHDPATCLAWLSTLHDESDYSCGIYRKLLINCPVDVKATDSDGNVIASFADGDPEELSESNYIYYVDENGQKVVILPGDGNYDVDITATDDGTMDYSIAEVSIADGECLKKTDYRNISISKGMVLNGSINVIDDNNAEYTLQTEEQILKPAEVIMEEEYCNITSVIEGNGSVNGDDVALKGEFVRYQAIPDEGNSFSGWYSSDGELISREQNYRFRVLSDMTLTARFIAGSEGDITGITLDRDSLSIEVNKTAVLKATLTPSEAGSQTVTWSSSDDSVVSVDASGKITANTYGHAVITATTDNGLAASCDVFSMFYDVADSSKYYFSHVYWAADAGITKGYGLKYFDPQGECTREQMVMFLWRLAGQPEPKTAVSSFADVKKGAYYYKAVLWAAENGITKGYSSGKYKGKFGVGLSCTREDAMTFLWRLAGKPEPASMNNPFPDVKASAYYYKPVLWANEQGIAKGYTSGQYKGKYGVGVTCLREHMVTFLSRYDSKVSN